MAHSTGLTVKECKHIIKSINDAYPIEELKAELISYARKNRGYFKDVLGRRLHVPAIVFDKKGQEYARAERQCFNYLIQGSAASIFKKLQNDAAENYLVNTMFMKQCDPATVPSLKQLLQVHDEVVYEVPNGYAEDACKVLTALYTNDTILSANGKAVPITCEFQFAQNWYDAKEKKA